jgi:hypothetical protein
MIESDKSKTTTTVVGPSPQAGWVPKQCDCTDLKNDNVVTVNSTNNNDNELAYYDPSIHAHGVQHHGATYQTTLEQDKLIYQELIKRFGYDFVRNRESSL